MMTETQIAQLYRDERAYLHRNVRSRVGGASVEDIEDAVAFGFMQLVKHRERVIPGAGAGWVYIVACREAYKIVQRNRWRQELEESSGSVEWEYVDDLLEQVLQLRRKRATALVGRMLGLTYSELAQATGHSYRSVDRHVTEGRAELRERMEAA